MECTAVSGSMMVDCESVRCRLLTLDSPFREHDLYFSAA